MTVHFCCNMDGSDKVPLWVIGRAKKPRAFSAAKVNINNLDVVYRSNKKARMTSGIFEEWLHWFDNRLGDRKIILLMDNFLVHELAVRSIDRTKRELNNILVVCLPASSTHCFQPLDQGIITLWKSHWRNRWIAFLLAEHEAGNDPVSRMNILHAIRWSISTWILDVAPTTIENCFRKGLFDEATEGESSLAILAEISEGIRRLKVKNYIREAMELSNFLNPEEEIVEDNVDDLDDQIMADFIPGESSGSDTDESPQEIHLISYNEAIEAIKIIRLFQEQTRGNKELVRGLIQEGHEIALLQRASLRQ